MRRRVLSDAIEYYQFKSEYKYLDGWIQEQIEHIKTDGIGESIEECETLLKESEDFARQLIVKEDRITAFGQLSERIIHGNVTASKVGMHTFVLCMKVFMLRVSDVLYLLCFCIGFKKEKEKLFSTDDGEKLLL